MQRVTKHETSVAGVSLSWESAGYYLRLYVGAFTNLTKEQVNELIVALHEIKGELK